MRVDENLWKFMQAHLGYNDEEIEKFRNNPRNTDVLEKASELMNKTIIAEVVESRNCNSEHRVGDRSIDRVLYHVLIVLYGSCVF